MAGIAFTVLVVAGLIAVAIYLLSRRPESFAWDQQATPSDARVLARMLVSEIRLYRGRDLEAGRRSRDIYRRLQTDIDRARQLFDARCDPARVNGHDYFYEALVEILAEGDAALLGHDDPAN